MNPEHLLTLRDAIASAGADRARLRSAAEIGDEVFDLHT
jgi:hypothetical protein